LISKLYAKPSVERVRSWDELPGELREYYEAPQNEGFKVNVTFEGKPIGPRLPLKHFKSP